MQNHDLAEKAVAVRIHLRRDSAAELRIEAAEFRQGSIRGRLAFDAANRLADLCRDDFAQVLGDIWAQLGRSPCRLDRPDYLAACGPASLTGLDALHTPGRRPGRSCALVCFTGFTGTPRDLFKVRLPFTGEVLEQRERLAVEALADIVSPLLRLASLPGDGPYCGEQTERIAARLNLLRDQADDLYFKFGLLSRYVRECGDQGRDFGRRDPTVCDLAPVPRRLRQPAQPAMAGPAPAPQLSLAKR